MTEEKTLGALEQTIQNKAKLIFLEKLTKAMDIINDNENLEILKDLKSIESLKKYCKSRYCLKETSIEMIESCDRMDSYREEKWLKQFREEQVKKIGMELSDDFLQQYKKYGE